MIWNCCFFHVIGIATLLSGLFFENEGGLSGPKNEGFWITNSIILFFFNRTFYYITCTTIENRFWMSTMQTWNNFSSLLITIKFDPSTATNTASITSNRIITAQNGMTDNRTYLLQQMTMTATTIRRNSSKMISKGMRTLISLGPGKKEKERKDVYSNRV